MSGSLMAEDECEVELRDMVAEALENNGVLPKIRAQLRASVFLALDETGRPGGDQARRFQSAALRSLAARPAGRRCLALVHELLTCLQLDCTLSVLDAELAPLSPGWREERPRLAAALGVQPADDEPVLAALLTGHTEAGGGSPPDTATASATASASDEEDSFFDSLPKLRSSGLSLPAAGPAERGPPPAGRSDGGPAGELPPLSGRGQLPPLRHGQLPSLTAPSHRPTAEADPEPAEHSVSEELEPTADSLASELQSDGLTDDISINSAAELQADLIESV